MIFDVFEKSQKHDTICKLDTNSGQNMTLNKNITLLVNMTRIAETTVSDTRKLQHGYIGGSRGSSGGEGLKMLRKFG